MKMRKGEATTAIIIGLLLTILGALISDDLNIEQHDTNTTKSVSE